MSKPFEEKPDAWAEWGDGNVQEVPGSGGRVYYAVIGDGLEVGGKASNLWVWHWHTPTIGEARWQIAGCGLHTVTSTDPLHIEPSLTCDDGCPSHGWIRDGHWTDA